MTIQFKHIGIITRPQTPLLQNCLHELIDYLHEHQLNIFLDTDTVSEGLVPPQMLAHCRVIEKSQLGKHCDLVMVLGGDGTFLSAARSIAPYRIPLIGINQGHLGFLTQVSRENMLSELRTMLTGHHHIEDHILLEASLKRKGQTLCTSLALNDVVISRGGSGQMIEFEVFINRKFVYNQRSDGIIVSTPTGSTAYALAAGGPILQAGLRVFSLVPICPQSMTNRPITIADTSEIDILILKTSDSRAHFDGQSYIDTETGDVICIRRYQHSLRVLHPANYSYYETLRQKLHWGEQLIQL